MYVETPTIEEFDAELFQAIVDENRRQEEHIELIASENYVSSAVLAALVSVVVFLFGLGDVVPLAATVGLTMFSRS